MFIYSEVTKVFLDNKTNVLLGQLSVVTCGVLGFEIGARSLVEVLPVVKVKSD